MLHKDVPYHSNPNVPAMTKPLLPRWGDGPYGLVRPDPGILQNTPKGERKNNRGEKKEIRPGWDILLNLLAG